MGPSVAVSSQALALELHGLLHEIDPARWRDRKASHVLTRWEDFDSRLHEVIEAARDENPLATITRLLVDLWELLRAYMPSAADARAELQSEWEALRQRLQPAYERLAASLRAEDIHVPALRPTNYFRNLLHIGTACFSLCVVAAIPSTAVISIITLVCAVIAWSLETTRRIYPEWNDKLMAALGRFAHPHEAHRVNSSTWYTTALFLLALTGSKPLCIVGVTVLGAGDPIAALIGRRFGKVKLINGRTLEGSMSFVFAATIVAFFCLAIGFPGLGTGNALIVAAFASVVGAMTELASRRVDDNFSIPVFSAAAAALAFTLLGLSF